MRRALAVLVCLLGCQGAQRSDWTKLAESHESPNGLKLPSLIPDSQLKAFLLERLGGRLGQPPQGTMTRMGDRALSEATRSYRGGPPSETGQVEIRIADAWLEPRATQAIRSLADTESVMGGQQMLGRTMVPERLVLPGGVGYARYDEGSDWPRPRCSSVAASSPAPPWPRPRMPRTRLQGRCARSTPWRSRDWRRPSRSARDMTRKRVQRATAAAPARSASGRRRERGLCHALQGLRALRRLHVLPGAVDPVHRCMHCVGSIGVPATARHCRHPASATPAPIAISVHRAWAPAISCFARAAPTAPTASGASDCRSGTSTFSTSPMSAPSISRKCES